MKLQNKELIKLYETEIVFAMAFEKAEFLGLSYEQMLETAVIELAKYYACLKAEVADIRIHKMNTNADCNS